MCMKEKGLTAKSRLKAKSKYLMHLMEPSMMADDEVTRHKSSRSNSAE